MAVTLYQRTNGGITEINLGRFAFRYPHNAQALVEMFEQRRSIIKELVRLIRPGVTVPFIRVETENLQAYQLVIAAHHAQRQDDCKQIQRAETFLRQALALDANFSYAWQQLYDNIHRQVWMCNAQSTLLEEALLAAEQVDKLTPNRYHSVVQGRSVILTETGRVFEGYAIAMAFYHQLDNKNDIDANARLAYALRYAGFLNKAQSYVEHMLDIDSLAFSNVPIDWTPNTLLYQGKYQRYLDLLANNESYYHRFYRGLALTQMGDKAAAIALLAQSDSPSDDLFAKFNRALHAVLTEQPQLANHLIADISFGLHGSGNSDGEMTYKVAQLFALAGNDKQALFHLALAVEQGYFCVNYFLRDPIITPLKANPKFAKIISQAVTLHRQFAKRFNLEPEVLDPLY